MKTLNNAFFKNPEIVKLTDQISELIEIDILQTIQSERDPGVYKYRGREFTSIKGKKIKTPGAVFTGYYQKLPDNKKLKVDQKIDNLLTKKDSNFFNSLKVSKIDLKSKNSILEQISSSKPSFEFNFDQINFKDMFSDKVGHASTNQPESSNNGPTAGLKKQIKEVEFILNYVECVDETDPEFLGKDEINMMGIAIDDKGETSKISEFEVGSFNDGDKKTYSSGKNLKKFIPGSDYSDGKIYLIQLFLIEKDNGGAGEFLTQAYEAIQEYINKIIKENGAKAISAAIAAAAGTEGTSLIALIGTVLAALSALALSKLIELISVSLDDDVFETTGDHLSSIVVESSTDSFDGSSESTKNMIFEDHGGKYKVNYSWKLIME